MRGVLLALALLALASGCGGGESSATGGDGCERVEAPTPREPGSHEAPTEPLAAGTSYALVFETTCGTFTIGLDTELAPNTAASLVALARDGYFDDTVFHRIVPGFVIQGGDPTATGSGGPGYSVRDVPPADAVYSEGVVAMAKSATEPPGTAGSQFYIVTAPDAGLPPEYGLLGRVVKGIEVAQAIDKLGDPASGDAGTPLQPVVIEKASVNES
jgi:cyclophilin family peptidyl-prolyl cis-trans isomerase